MYQSHFNLHDRPFASAPNPEHYFPAASMEQAREVLELNIERATGVNLLMGPVGCGKSLLCQVLANQFSPRLPVCLLPGERLRDRTMLFQAILHRLDLPYRGQDEGELRLTLSQHIAGAACPQGILLIVDEADRLPLELLEEVRVLTNVVQDGRPCVRLVLAGTSRLEERVGHPKMESLNQRVVGRFHLTRFNHDETASYVRERVTSSGGDELIFSDEALSAVQQATGGVPRLINQVCDHALLMSSLEACERVDGALVEEAWADLQQLPLPSRAPTPANDDDASDAVVEFGSLDEEEQEPARETEVEFPSILDEPVAADVSIDVDHPAGDDTESEHALSLPATSPDTATVIIESAMNEPDGEVARAEEPTLSPEEDDLPSILPSPFVDTLHQEPAGVDSEESVLTIAEAENPFSEEFAEEEVVIQDFVSPSALARQGQVAVCSPYSQHLAHRLEAAHPGLRVLPQDNVEEAASPDEFQPLSACLPNAPSDDLESISIEEAVADSPSTVPAAPSANVASAGSRPKVFRNLFSSLKRA